MKLVDCNVGYFKGPSVATVVQSQRHIFISYHKLCNVIVQEM